MEYQCYLETSKKEQLEAAKQLKMMDKLYSKTLEIVKEEIAVKFLSMVKNNGFIETILFCLKIVDIKTCMVLIKAGSKIEFYRKQIQENMSTFMMISLNSPMAMKFCLDLEVLFAPLPQVGKLNEQMTICLYKHALKYPENRDKCISCIKSYNYEESYIYKPFFFLKDEVEIVANYFSKNDTVKAVVVNNCVDFGATKILRKAIKYYKLSNSVNIKMSLPILLSNLRDFNIFEDDNRDLLMFEVFMEGRWDFLPFIFENFKINNNNWEYLRHSLYQGRLNIYFLKTLLFLMNKYNYSYDLLIDKTYKIIFCDKEVEQELKSSNLLQDYEFKVGIKITKMNENHISEMFKEYNNGNKELIEKYLFMSYAHRNNRFLDEKENAVKVATSNNGWNESMIKKFMEFNDFCDYYCSQLTLCDDLLLEYNSYIASSISMPHMMQIRFINKVLNILGRIKEQYLLNEYNTLITKFYDEYYDVMEKVRKDLNIDLTPMKKWKLPENPTLMDMFRDLYQNSEFKYKNDENDEIIRVLDYLKREKMNKIANEVEACVASLVPIEDIIEILKRKKILE